MVSAIFAALAAGQLLLGWQGLRRWRADGGRFAALPTVLCLALVYDNAVIAMGSTLGPGPMLETLSAPRFVMHAMLTPLLIPWSRDVVARAGLAAARSLRARVGAWLLAAILIVTGVGHFYFQLSAQPTWWAGTLRYSDTAATFAATAPVLVSGLTVLIVGIFLWQRHSFAGLAVPAFVMAAVAGLSTSVPVLGNTGELVFDAGLIATARRSATCAVDRLM